MLRRLVFLLSIASPAVAPAVLVAQPVHGAALRAIRAEQYDSAIALLEVAVAGDAAVDRAWMMLGTAYLRSGRVADAISAQRTALSFPEVRPAAMYNLGLAHGAAGRLDSAFHWLAEAKRTGRANLADIDLDPDADPLREDPRYAALKPTEAELSKPFAEGGRILREWRGEAPGDLFGWIARRLDDVDGDGVDDVVTSATAHGGGAGRVYVYSTASGKRLWSADGAPGTRLGTGLEAAGDVNADGIDDVIASGGGVALVFSGRDGEVLLSLSGQEGDGFGTSAAGAGDVNGDGHADVVVGAPQHEGVGRAYVFSGRDGTPLLVVDGTRPGGRFGSAVHGASTGDGFRLAIGAGGGGPSGTGEVRVWDRLAQEPSHVIAADSGDVALGAMFVAIAGDVDADGTPDVYASDWRSNAGGPGAGRVVVVSGATGETLLSRTGETPGEGFGTSSSVAGDVDGDGHADLIVGSWQYAGEAISGGRLSLVSGKDGSLVRTWTGAVPGETLGYDAVGIADVDGDGVRDLLVTSAQSSANGSLSGRVLVVSGAR